MAGIIDDILNQDNGRVKYIILNLCKITEIDSSGCNILGQICKRCQKKGIQIWISSSRHHGIEHRIIRSGVPELIKSDTFHNSLNYALGSAEDMLLNTALGFERNEAEKSLEEISVLSAFKGEELQILSGHMQNTRFDDAAIVFRQGDVGDRIFFIVKGRARIEFTSPTSTKPSILAVICPGMPFGEMAIIDGSSRSASIIADGELICVSMGIADIERLRATYPVLVEKLYHGIALILSQRLRIANRINSELQS